LGIDVDFELARTHPYDPKAYLNIFKDGWEKRLGQPA
jgi:galactonate dehydratase